MKKSPTQIICCIATVLCIIALPLQSQAKTEKPKIENLTQPEKEKVILLPMVVSEDTQNMLSQMQSAVVQGLEQKYLVFSGERVLQELKKAANKENHAAKHDCDETRCLQDISIAFQTENVAVVHITKVEGGFLLSLSIKDVMSNQSVFDNSLTCKGCDSFQVIDKLKQLSGAAPPVAEQPQANSANDAETILWGEVKKGNSADDYQAYLGQYPNGKFSALARSQLDRIKRQPVTNIAADPQPAKVIKDCPDCPELVALPAGRFNMGSPGNEPGRANDEGPVHSVSVNAFLMGRTHITRRQFAIFVNATHYDAGNKCITFENGKVAWHDGRSWRNPGYAQEFNHPVTCINWHDAQAYTQWLSRKTGKQYRLPTEAEWEYAVRAGGSSGRYWATGPDNACSFANVADQTLKNQVSGVKWEIHNCNDGYAFTSPVGSFKPNAFGLYDMQGNLWQWVADSWHDNYNGAPGDGSEWQGNDSQRVLRGGSWNNDPKRVRSAARNKAEAARRAHGIGFRIARALQ